MAGRFWLNEISAALGFLQNDMIRGLLKMEVKVEENNQSLWQSIQEMVPYVLEESWADCYNLYVQLAGLETVSTKNQRPIMDYCRPYPNLCIT